MINLSGESWQPYIGLALSLLPDEDAARLERDGGVGVQRDGQLPREVLHLRPELRGRPIAVAERLWGRPNMTSQKAITPLTVYLSKDYHNQNQN